MRSTVYARADVPGHKSMTTRLAEYKQTITKKGIADGMKQYERKDAERGSR
jgi:hypothetical protein